MAQIFDSFENLLECSVCWEQYNLTENDRLPRFLPCTHTVCECCLKTLLDGDETRRKCPECREPFPQQEVHTFPQNKHALQYIRYKTSQTQIEQQTICVKHGEDLHLYCRETGCGKAICEICREKKHKDHVVLELKEFREDIHEDLVANAAFLKEYLRSSKEKLLVTRDDLKQRFRACATKLENEREKNINTFRRVIAEYDYRQKTVKDRWEEAKGVLWMM